MPHIPLESHLPGTTGLLEYRQDTALPIRNLTQILLRGESTLTPAERELIATGRFARQPVRFLHVGAHGCCQPAAERNDYRRTGETRSLPGDGQREDESPARHCPANPEIR